MRGSLVARRLPDWAVVERRERMRFAHQERAAEEWRARLAEQGRRLAALREHNLRLMALRAELMRERLRRRPGLRSRPAVTAGAVPSGIRQFPVRGGAP